MPKRQCLSFNQSMLILIIFKNPIFKVIQILPSKIIENVIYTQLYQLYQ